MPAERAGVSYSPHLYDISLTFHHKYTVTMFLVDTSPSMGKTREVQIPGTNGGDPETIEMTNLEWSLQYVMLKIQEMVRGYYWTVRPRLMKCAGRSSTAGRPTNVA